MPHFSLSYNIQDMYQIIADVLYSLWPIIAAGLGIAMAAFLLYMVTIVFRKWVDEK